MLLIWNSSYGSRRPKLRPGEKSVARKKPKKVKTKSLTRVVEQRDEAVGEGAEESPKTLRTKE